MREVVQRYTHVQEEPAKTWRVALSERAYPGAVVLLDDEFRSDYWDEPEEGFRFGPATVWVDTQTVEIRFHQPVTGNVQVIY